MSKIDDKSDSERARTLFLLALTSRAVLFLLVAHWGLIGAAVLVDVPIEWSAELTFVHSIILGIGCLIVFSVLNRDGRVADRMRQGPGRLQSHSVPIIVVAAASDVGGILLYLHVEEVAALWAMGLSTIVVVCEISALVGSLYLETNRS